MSRPVVNQCRENRAPTCRSALIGDRSILVRDLVIGVAIAGHSGSAGWELPAGRSKWTESPLRDARWSQTGVVRRGGPPAQRSFRTNAQPVRRRR